MDYIFVVDNFLIAIHAFEVGEVKVKYLQLREKGGGRRRQSDTLASLRLLSPSPNFKPSYLKSVNSYRKVVNCKNEEIDLIYKFNSFSNFLAPIEKSYKAVNFIYIFVKI